MVARADRFTTRSFTPIVYRDFTNNFKRDTTNDSLQTVTNEDAIKQAIANIVLTIKGERFYDSSFGSRTNALLFEPSSVLTEQQLVSEIKQAIENHCPRAIQPDVRVQAVDDQNGYIVSVGFTLLNIQKQFSVDIFVQRVR